MACRGDDAKTRCRVGLLSLMLLAPAAQAQPKAEIDRRYSKAFDRCVNGTGDFAMQGTGYGNLDCAKGEMLRLNDKLNAVYRSAIDRLKPQPAINLRQSQRDWIRARDRKCRSFEAARTVRDPTDESGDPWCIMEETIRRTIWLERRR